MSRLTLKQNTEQKRAFLVSVLSGKGGVGKSITTFNLGERLCARGVSVLLIDADFNFGNLHIYANLTSESGIQEVLSGHDVIENVLLKVNPFLHLLPASYRQTDYDIDSVETAVKLVQLIKKISFNYDCILIDNASGLSRFATTMAFASDMNLLVAVPELTSISDCYGLYKHLKKQDAALDCRLLLNRLEKEADAEFIYSRIGSVAERFIGECPKYFGAIREDKAMIQALAAQQPAALNSPKATVVKDLTSLAGKLDELRQQSPEVVVLESERINITTAYADIKE